MANTNQKSAIAKTDKRIISADQEAARLIDAMTVARSIGQHEKAAQCWREAVALIQARTPEQVKRMEAERGLI